MLVTPYDLQDKPLEKINQKGEQIKKLLPHRELNPGLPGESRVS